MSYHAPMPPIDILNQKFTLDEENGCLVHKKKFGIREGTIAGSRNPAGYLRVNINKRIYLVHRVIYFMSTGKDPGEMEVDHIDGNKHNNRPCNLRLATRSQNRQNVEAYKSNSLGKKGVYFNVRRKAYLCSVQVNGKRVQFGPFDTSEEAYEVYKKESKSRFKQFYPENRI